MYTWADPAQAWITIWSSSSVEGIPYIISKSVENSIQMGSAELDFYSPEML